MQAGDLIQSRYRLIAKLGAGASGSVWSAKNELIDRDVALKIMKPDVADDAVALQRFFNEAKASGRVRSPAIVEILDLGQAEDGSPFLVFELLEGESLDQRLSREGVLEPEMAAELFSEIARALDKAHAASIVHRDLKPANIYLHTLADGKVVPKILDFGISKVYDSQNNFTLTRTGTVVGSPAYMAPEQASGQEDLDGRADIWALGVVMYESLAGSLPHEAPNYNALMLRILTQDVDPLITRNKDLPASLCAVVDACLRRDRDERSQSSGIVSSQLEAAAREMRAVRLRAQGRRASDRSTNGDFRRRAADAVHHSAPPPATGHSVPPPHSGGMVATATAPEAFGAAQKRRFILIAAAIGVAVGLLAVLVGAIVMR